MHAVRYVMLQSVHHVLGFAGEKGLGVFYGRGH